MADFLGFDHVDTRVRSLAAVEAFYDNLMPAIGLPDKQRHNVDATGNWSRAKPGEQYNTIEYHERSSDRRPAHFIGFIEDPAMKPVSTRIAFRIASVAELDRWVALLGRIGACNIEPSSSYEDWPAVFFEDPAGTKLEVVGRD
jgi:catechol 2,3-dioxygenase-like lactoylglutathione lyase family enzyme